MVDVISVHVPKTAGTSFRRALETVVPLGAVLGDYGDWLDDPRHPFHTNPPAWQQSAAAFVAAIRPEVRIVHGHFSAVKYRQAFPSARWITWLRHPIARLVSHYHFWRAFPREAAPGHPLLAPIQDGRMGLLDLAEVPVMRDLASQHYLRGMALEDFTFVGLQEHYAADLGTLGRTLGWPHLPLLNDNRNPQPEYQAALRQVFRDRSLLRRLNALNAGDLQLYEATVAARARRVRGRWWRSLVPWLAQSA